MKDLAAQLCDGCVYHSKRWSGDAHDDLGGSIDEQATDTIMEQAANEIDRLWAIESAARALTGVAAASIRTLAERGHESVAFEAAGDQWDAAYAELKDALAVKGDVGD